MVEIDFLDDVNIADFVVSTDEVASVTPANQSTVLNAASEHPDQESCLSSSAKKIQSQLLAG